MVASEFNGEGWEGDGGREENLHGGKGTRRKRKEL